MAFEFIQTTATCFSSIGSAANLRHTMFMPPASTLATTLSFGTTLKSHEPLIGASLSSPNVYGAAHSADAIMAATAYSSTQASSALSPITVDLIGTAECETFIPGLIIKNADTNLTAYLVIDQMILTGSYSDSLLAFQATSKPYPFYWNFEDQAYIVPSLQQETTYRLVFNITLQGIAGRRFGAGDSVTLKAKNPRKEASYTVNFGSTWNTDNRYESFVIYLDSLPSEKFAFYISSNIVSGTPKTLLAGSSVRIEQVGA